MTNDPKTTKIAWGNFSVRQAGQIMASGSGPYDDIRREADHYAAVYRQGGVVRVSVRRLADREVKIT